VLGSPSPALNLDIAFPGFLVMQHCGGCCRGLARIANLNRNRNRRNFGATGHLLGRLHEHKVVRTECAEDLASGTRSSTVIRSNYPNLKNVKKGYSYSPSQYRCTSVRYELTHFVQSRRDLSSHRPGLHPGRKNNKKKPCLYQTLQRRLEANAGLLSATSHRTLLTCLRTQ
jgi:hypothetical protein